IASKLSKHALFEGALPILNLDGVTFLASAPVRSLTGKILGVLSIFFYEPRYGLSPDELHMLESLADMAASQLELRRLRKCLTANDLPQPYDAVAAATWPSSDDLHQALDKQQFVLYYQPEIELSTRKIVGLE